MNTNPEASTSGYIKVGRITLPIARKARVKCADIMIDNRHIEQINKKHKVELDALGISAMGCCENYIPNHLISITVISLLVPRRIGGPKVPLPQEV